jgi:hypothetical protein
MWGWLPSNGALVRARTKGRIPLSCLRYRAGDFRRQQAGRLSSDNSTFRQDPKSPGRAASVGGPFIEALALANRECLHTAQAFLWASWGHLHRQLQQSPSGRLSKERWSALLLTASVTIGGAGIVWFCCSRQCPLRPSSACWSLMSIKAGRSDRAKVRIDLSEN